jgi:ATP-dependent Clp protease ATP-binding subunit ClpB
MEVYDELKKSISPEFLNRIDEIIVFNPLTRDEIKKIAELQFKLVQKMLVVNNIQVSITPDAIDWLAELGYDPQLGARPLKRVIQRKILNELSKLILQGTVAKDSEIVVELKGSDFVFTNKSELK